MTKLALCINRSDAPQNVLLAFRQGIIGLVPMSPLFFLRSTHMVDRMICDDVSIDGRATAEQTLQLLPYLVFRTPSGKLLTYTRGSHGDESRLHARLSVGFGGHVDRLPNVGLNGKSNSEALLTLLREEAAREGLEETGIVMDLNRIRFTDFIIANTPVDRVHLGLLCIYEVPEDQEIHAEEGTIIDPHFAEVSHLTSTNDIFTRLENWSKAVVTM